MKVPAPYQSYNHLRMSIFQEQQVYTLGYSNAVARCVWCGELGGVDTVWTRPFPGKPVIALSDLHHWWFKRGSGLPDELLNSPENVVVLHRHCHLMFGQTKKMTERCWQWKEGLLIGNKPKYDLYSWIERVKNG